MKGQQPPEAVVELNGALSSNVHVKHAALFGFIAM